VRMDLEQAPVVDVRPLLSRERADLVRLLRTLSPAEWDKPTAVPGWTVKDLGLHLLDDDLGWLSRQRDGERSGQVDSTVAYRDVAEAQAQKNQRFVDALGGLSTRMLCDLLAWSGDERDTYYADVDLRAEGSVIWASDGSVPMWFDLARDLAQRWLYQHQMREALSCVGDFEASYVPAVLRTFVWALPHQYRVWAPNGTTVDVDLAAGGVWHLAATVAGRWSLAEGPSTSPAARATFSGAVAWRWLTGAAYDRGEVSVTGQQHLIGPLLAVRALSF